MGRRLREEGIGRQAEDDCEEALKDENPGPSRAITDTVEIDDTEREEAGERSGY